MWNNEFEYLDNKANDNRTINTAQSIMNWLAFGNAPTWFWLHALKPTVNIEAPGYGLGYWRPFNDTNFTRFPDLLPGHWTYNSDNANAVMGFAKYMPWDSVRVSVAEDALRSGARVLAYLFDPRAAQWKGMAQRRHHARVFDRPGAARDASARAAASHLAVVLTNSDAGANFTAGVVLMGLPAAAAGGAAPVFEGHGYGPSAMDEALGNLTAAADAYGHWQLNVTLPPLSIQFWVQFF